MKERPILFSGPMVRAILDESKTQTRRVCKAQTQGQADIIAHAIVEDEISGDPSLPNEKAAWERIGSPYGQPGERLWVRETFGYTDSEDEVLTYKANNPTRLHELPARWRPSIHMPRSASRISLEIVSVRAERLQDISENDALWEGISIPEDHYYIGGYRGLWESINGHGSWDANPFVWVVEFKRIGGNA